MSLGCSREGCNRQLATEFSLDSQNQDKRLVAIKKSALQADGELFLYSAACCQRLASMRDRLEIARLKLK